MVCCEILQLGRGEFAFDHLQAFGADPKRASTRADATVCATSALSNAAAISCCSWRAAISCDPAELPAPHRHFVESNLSSLHATQLSLNKGLAIASPLPA